MVSLRKKIKAPRKFDDPPGESPPQERQRSYQSSESEENSHNMPKKRKDPGVYLGPVIEFNPNRPPAAFPTLDHPSQANYEVKEVEPEFRERLSQDDHDPKDNEGESTIPRSSSATSSQPSLPIYPRLTQFRGEAGLKDDDTASAEVAKSQATIERAIARSKQALAKPQDAQTPQPNSTQTTTPQVGSLEGEQPDQDYTAFFVHHRKLHETCLENIRMLAEGNTMTEEEYFVKECATSDEDGNNGGHHSRTTQCTRLTND